MVYMQRVSNIINQIACVNRVFIIWPPPSYFLSNKLTANYNQNSRICRSYPDP